MVRQIVMDASEALGGNKKINKRSPKKGGEINVQHWNLYKAAIHGDWETAESIIKDNPDALTAPVGPYSEIALHVAVTTRRSVQFVRNLVQKMSSESLITENELGETALHYAACAGNTQAAEILEAKNSILPQRIDSEGYSALHIAALFGHKETVSYLLSVTRDVEPSPFAEKTGVFLLNSLILADFYDMALYLLKRYPKLALEKDKFERTALGMLASKPHAFESGSRLGRGQRLIYHCTGVDNKDNPPPRGDIENDGASHQSSEKYLKVSKPFRFIQHIENTMLMHKQAMELLRILIDAADSADRIVAPLFEAAKLGITEIVVEAIKAYPYLIRYKENEKGETVFHVAVLHRQEKIYNLLYQMSSQRNIAAAVIDNNKNTLLHDAGKLESSDSIFGAALQMQRELQWFKEVEKIVQPSYREQQNNDKKTPRMLFTESHKDLVKQSEKWMKGTASSFALVAALIVTVVFAAAFTIPGGNNSEGILKQTSFLVFAVSDILALFSSITSLLMFLGILTSRYAEEDFLSALPMRLSIGLITLFFSMAAMLVAFSASFYIVLAPRFAWIAIPIGVLASVPVILFAFLQFSLLVQIVAATFGPSIFGKQSDEIIF